MHGLANFRSKVLGKFFCGNSIVLPMAAMHTLIQKSAKNASSHGATFKTSLPIF
jgi:hypothetical protein